MTPLEWAVLAILTALTIWAICSTDSREKAERLIHADAVNRHRIVVIGTSDAPIADALAQALEQHMDAGEQLVDVAGYEVIDHPCGKNVLRLVLAGDAVAGAEAILRGAS